MKTQSKEIYFQELELKFHDIIYNKFTQKLTKARNKELVKHELVKGHLIQYYHCFTFNPLRDKIFIDFLYYYERGIPIDEAINNIIEERTKHNAYGIKFIDDFFEKASEMQILRIFAKFTAYQRFIDYIRNEHNDIYEIYERELVTDLKLSDDEVMSPIPFKRNSKEFNENNNSNIKLEKETNDLIIKWTSGNSKTEFVKLIYALFNAKFINNGKGEITKIVEELAITFNVELSKSWQSNFSKNKNYTNGGHDQLELFEKIKVAYEDYINK